MAVREVKLPGIDTNYTIETQATGRVVIVPHHTGKQEIFHFASDVLAQRCDRSHSRRATDRGRTQADLYLRCSLVHPSITNGGNIVVDGMKCAEHGWIKMFWFGFFVAV